MITEQTTPTARTDRVIHFGHVRESFGSGVGAIGVVDITHSLPALAQPLRDHRRIEVTMGSV